MPKKVTPDQRQAVLRMLGPVQVSAISAHAMMGTDTLPEPEEQKQDLAAPSPQEEMAVHDEYP